MKTKKTKVDYPIGTELVDELGIKWVVEQNIPGGVRLVFRKPGVFYRTGKPYGPVYMDVTEGCGVRLERA